MERNRFTPATIGNCKFNIPLYQRLFEWEDEQVNQLLQDLYASFKQNKEKPYYIGVLTVFKDISQDRFSLVDGQQRFTVLMLLSIVLGWEDFSLINEEIRLSFFARRQDEEYLRAKVLKSNSQAYSNSKMEAAINAIASFLEKKVKAPDSDEFRHFIKSKTTFFLSNLPSSYSAAELNRYFEAMNEAGKGLENHEILKIQLLRKLNEENRGYYTQIWNEVSEIDKCLIQQKESESTEEYVRRNYSAFKNPHSVFANTLISDSTNESSIFSIKPSKEKPIESLGLRDEAALLNFQDFLLLVLSLTMNNQIAFDKKKLLATFQKLIDSNEQEVKSFIDNLLHYRLLFDYFIIRTTSSDGRTTTYTLNYSPESGQSKHALIQYQSMLHVSTTYNIWLKPLLEKLLHIQVVDDFKDFKFLAHLKAWDNQRHANYRDLIPDGLSYISINRYWLWRLDYYLWERREELFSKETKKIADQYVFRANRSIEHIAPQNPKEESRIELKEAILHSFGNLAMISSSQNSSLKNASYEIKKAYIQSFMNRSVYGSIESLKLLKILEFDTWNEASVKKHQEKMVSIIIKSLET